MRSSGVHCESMQRPTVDSRLCKVEGRQDGHRRCAVMLMSWPNPAITCTHAKYGHRQNVVICESEVSELAFCPAFSHLSSSALETNSKILFAHYQIGKRERERELALNSKQAFNSLSTHGMDSS
jgi:hypothetical protein